MTRSFAAALEAFVLMLAVSVVHRLLAFAVLAGGAVELASFSGLQAVAVGLASDIWVCDLIALVVLGLHGASAVIGSPMGGRVSSAVLLLALGIGAALHQSYVDFFHFQIIPFHLAYLIDRQFLLANYPTAFTLRSFIVFAAFVAAGAWLLVADPFGQWRVKRQAWTLVVLSLAAIVLHNRNINYRVQWFIPSNLQVNSLERLWLHLETDRTPGTLAPTEVKSLTALLGDAPQPFASPISPSQFFGFLTQPANAPAPLPLTIAARGAFAKAKAAHAKPVLMILLLESLRPSETGYFAAQLGATAASGPSLTPALDDLAAHGVAFMQAYSTGTVTRGAQEAAFCGYLGSWDTSLMRGESIARLTCLPDLVAGAGGDTFWYHGGDPRFDGQVMYWKLHAVREFMSEIDFPADAPRGGWGVSDKAYLAAAAQRVVDFHARSTADYLLGMGLTVTNHIPWDLPTDAGPETQAPRASGHPSYATTAYTDAALGDFVARLKAAGLWKDLLLIVASDHGNGVQPLVDLYGNSSAKGNLLWSHINLILAGGLMEEALASQGMASARRDEIVSQADLAAFAGYVLDLPAARFMGQTLLARGRALPVLSDLEVDLFDHISGKAFSRTEVAHGDPAAFPVEERKALLYYRAFLQYIYTAPPRTGF